MIRERPLHVTRAIADAHARLLALRGALDDMAGLRAHPRIDPPGPDGAGPVVTRIPGGRT